MMEEVFLKLLNMSITAGWLILAVIVLRFCLKKAPKAIAVILWALVGVRLICPFSLESIFSIIPSAETVPSDILYSETPAIQSGIRIFNAAVNPILSETMAPAAGDSANPMQIVVWTASVIWAVGMAAMLVYTFISSFRIYRKVREATPLRENILLCDRISTPFILGIIRPRIFLPSAVREQDLVYVIAHEKAHLQRHDHLWKPLGFLLLTVYWFHPLIWVAYLLLCRDIEFACDEKVIREMGLEIKKNYADALINCSIPRRMIAACPLAFGEVSVKERVKNILHYRKPALFIVVAAAIACMITAVCLLTNPPHTAFSDPFGKNYSVDSLIYAAPQYNFVLTPETAPTYILTADGMLMTSSQNQTEFKGEAVAVSLTEYNFDQYFENNGIGGIWENTSAAKLREQNEKAWKVLTDNELHEFYYILQQNDGSVYLSYGYHDPEGETDRDADDSSIRWLFKLDIYEHTVSVSPVGGAEQMGAIYLGVVAYADWTQIADIHTPALNEFQIAVSSLHHLPLYRLDSVADIHALKECFKEETLPVSLRDEGIPSFDEATAAFDDPFFQENTLFLVPVPADGEAYRYDIGNVYNDGKKFLIRVDQLLSPEADTAGLDGWWFVLVSADRESVQDCTEFDTELHNEMSRVYVYRDSENVLPASFTLYEDNTFTFTFSAVSSYIGVGTYRIENDQLILTTDDGNFVYTFTAGDDGYIFDAENSSDMIWFADFQDGSVFR